MKKYLSDFLRSPTYPYILTFIVLLQFSSLWSSALMNTLIKTEGKYLQNKLIYSLYENYVHTTGSSFK